IPLMQDLPKEAQRIIYTANRNRVNALTERYARKALTVQMASVPTAPSPARTVSAAWEGRLRAVTDLIELLDPVSLAIWTLDRSHHRAIVERISLREPAAQLVTRGPVTAQTIIAFDLPTGERLRELAQGGEVVLLVPPGAEGYVASIADPRRPIQLPGAVEAALAAEAAQRSRIGQAIAAGGLEHSVATLAPLFERHDPVSVAAALFKLWTGSPESSATPVRQESTVSRIYVGAGKKDGVTPNDLVAVLTKELKVNREKIGRIELRDSFSLIEIPTAEADQVARGLNGATIRRRRVTARVDRGRTRPGRNSKV
ncbi:MAG TPA: DbpA RNA binding domain-containing protein, partial [Gemmatimonadales bacterium]|nr:DbpA RNA binding domain-containing protein [Gemmatimonadales bacterium]